MPRFHLLWVSPFAAKAGTYCKLSLSIGIPPAWVFSSRTDPTSVPALVFKLTFTTVSGLLSPLHGCMLCTTPTPLLVCPKIQSCNYSAVGMPNQSEALLTWTELPLWKPQGTDPASAPGKAKPDGTACFLLRQNRKIKTHHMPTKQKNGMNEAFLWNDRMWKYTNCQLEYTE